VVVLYGKLARKEAAATAYFDSKKPELYVGASSGKVVKELGKWPDNLWVVVHPVCTNEKS